MSFLTNLSREDRERCLHLLAQASCVSSHDDLARWLQGDLQRFLPHDILVAAWGDLQRGVMKVDIIYPHADQRTGALDAAALTAAIRQAFSRWLAASRRPCAIDAEETAPVFAGRPARMLPLAGSAFVHGLRDHRTGQDCLYIVLGRNAMHEEATQEVLTFLLPFLDTALRQVASLPTQGPPLPPGAGHYRPGVAQITLPPGHSASETGMTEREMQIMRWVEMGKTNQEIGTILDISTFTVKNHLQRIFKKLDVYSRAQAVSRFKDSRLHG